MRRHWIVVLFVVAFATSLSAQNKQTADAKPKTAGASVSAGPGARLPVKRVVLYKNGVGYFEHSTRVHGSEELTIDFTTAQLNDVLKSLTAVDLGEGRISAVRYNSIAPLEQRLKTLRLPFGEQITQTDFLNAVRGARVEARSGPVIALGRLLSVETEQRTNDKGASFSVTKFSVFTDGGEVRNFELGPGTSVRLAEHDLTDEVGKYLNLIGSSRAADLRRMTISATGVGDREVFVSYISEVPVWKSTYRIILSQKAGEKPLLQGWSIVDNTIGEDWKDVQLSLVAGEPQSFIENISQPYYTRRPVVQPPPSVMMTPQEHEGTMNGPVAPPPPPVEVFNGRGGGIGGGSFRGASTSLRGKVIDTSGGPVAGAQVTIRNEQSGASQTTTSDARGVYQFFNVESGNAALFVISPGFQRFELTNFFLGVSRANEIDARLQVGTSGETIEVQASTPVLETQSASVASVAERQHIEAESKDLGDYFEYNIKQPITIGKNQSALVPILQAHIDAEKVSLWNEESKEIRRALWITNSSGLTLDSGTFNILDGDTFAGEGLLETVHASERRLISYAGDPAVHIVMDTDSSPKPITRVRIDKGVIVTTREDHESRTFTVRNSDTQPRQVVIEHPAREGWRVEGAKPEETTESFLRFRLAVGPGQTEKLNLEESHPEDQQIEISNMEDEDIALILKDTRMTPAVQDALRRVQAQKNVVAGFEAQISTRQKEVATIEKDQARVRENMKALKGSAEEKALLQRYTRQLDSQEDRLAILQKEINDLQAQHDKAEVEMDQMIEKISLDEKL